MASDTDTARADPGSGRLGWLDGDLLRRLGRLGGSRLGGLILGDRPTFLLRDPGRDFRTRGAGLDFTLRDPGNTWRYHP